MADGRYWDPALETLAWPDVERWQVEQIARALPGLRARSGFYRTLHAGLGDDVVGFDDLARLPFTTKDQLRAAQDDVDDEHPLGTNQSAPLGDIVQLLTSSGTTGRPMYYALTRHDVECTTDAIANNWYTAGVRADDVVAHLVGLPMVAGGLPYADGFRRIGATLAWLGGFPTDRILREMRRLRCTALLATTSFGLHLAEQWPSLDAATGLPSRLTKLLGGGEPGLGQPAIRERIAGRLGIGHVRETMGLADVIAGMWAECEAQDGMHFNAQRHVAIELIDPDDTGRRPWQEGVTGEMVYTAFDREATPVVRYRSRDHVQVVGTGCRCGRTSPRIRCIGRTDDMLIYRGMNVFPSALRDLVASAFVGRLEPRLRVWKTRPDQVRFSDPIEIDVEASPGVAASAFALLAQQVETLVRDRLQVRVAVSVLEPDALPRGVYKSPLLAVRAGDRSNRTEDAG